MNNQLPTVKYNKSVLLAVPSVHYNHLFARLVNSLCSDPDTRPDAVAVELGPECAKSASEWLNELGVNKGVHLPVMLGLQKSNRCIPISKVEKAREIMRNQGKPISEIAVQVLYEELDYCKYELCCLSPADSIIEAVRCAGELSIPLFGVDMEECDMVKREGRFIGDPYSCDTIEMYINSTWPIFVNEAVSHTDICRETVMVSRLKSILSCYRKVLFVCGIAHWGRIANKMNDLKISPASRLVPEYASNKPEYTRITIDSRIASGYTDRFPAIAFEYEKSRVSPSLNGKRNEYDKLPIVELAEECLRKGYKSYYKESFQEKSSKVQFAGSEKIRLFEVLLSNRRLLESHCVDSVNTIVDCAEAVGGLKFAQSIAMSFLDFPWAGSSQFPHLPNLSPAGMCPYHTVTLARHDSRSGPFLVSSRRHSIPNSKLNAFDNLNKTKKEPKSFSPGFNHTWSAWDYLISGISIQAALLPRKKNRVNCSTPFY